MQGKQGIEENQRKDERGFCYWKTLERERERVQSIAWIYDQLEYANGKVNNIIGTRGEGKTRLEMIYELGTSRGHTEYR